MSDAVAYTPPLLAQTQADDNRQLLRQLIWLSVQVLAENLLHLFVSLTDTYLANHLPDAPDLRPAAASAVGTIGYLIWFIGLIVGAIATGSTAIIARAVGARHRSLANSVCGQRDHVGVAAREVAAGGHQPQPLLGVPVVHGQRHLHQIAIDAQREGGPGGEEGIVGAGRWCQVRPGAIELAARGLRVPAIQTEVEPQGDGARARGQRTERGAARDRQRQNVTPGWFLFRGHIFYPPLSLKTVCAPNAAGLSARLQAGHGGNHHSLPAATDPSPRRPSAREVAHEDGDKAEKDQTNHQSDHGDAERGRARTQEEQQNQSDRGNVKRHAKDRLAQVWAHRATSGVLDGLAGAAPD